MHYIALVIVCVALIAISFYSRKIAFAALAVIAIGLTILYYIGDDDVLEGDFEVAADLIVLEDLSAELSYGDNWNYTGRATNNSDKSVTDLKVRITLRDCEAGQTPPDDCVIIGDQADLLSINIPPRQARDFSDAVSFEHATPRGELNWTFELVGVSVSN